MFKPSRDGVCVLKRRDASLRVFGSRCLVFIVKWYFSHPVTALPFAEPHEWSSLWMRKEMGTAVGVPRRTPRPHACLPGAPDHKRGGAWLPCPFRSFQEHRVSSKWLAWQSTCLSSTRSAKKSFSHETGAVRKLFWVLHALNEDLFWTSRWRCSVHAGFPPGTRPEVLGVLGCFFSPPSLELLSPWLPSMPVPFLFPRWSQSTFLLLPLALPGLHSPPSPYPSTLKLRVPVWSLPRALQSTLCCGCCSVAQSCPTLLTPWTAACQASLSSTISQSCSNHDHWVGDAIQPSHPLSPTSPPALNLSQHQGLFQRVLSLHQVVKVLEVQLQYQSFQ